MLYNSSKANEQFLICLMTLKTTLDAHSVAEIKGNISFEVGSRHGIKNAAALRLYLDWRTATSLT